MKSKSEYLPLVILVALSLLIGLLTIHDYGESWDEYNFYNYAEESISAYSGIFQSDYKLEFHDPTLRYYGAGFLMLIVQIAKLFPNWIISDVGHLLTFLVFQIGIIILYLLARRWMKRWSALGVSLLIASQPVFWGHAFFNSRDIPFMVGFIATIYFGLRMSDSLAQMPIKESPPKVDPTPIVRADWGKLPKWARIILPLGSLVGIIALAALSMFLAGYWLEQGLPNTDASSARELDLYLRPLLSKFWAGIFFFLSSLLLSAALYLPFMPDFRKYIWQVELHPNYELLKSLLSNKKLLIASLALGLTVGIRIMGFAAAGLVGVLHLIRVLNKNKLSSQGNSVTEAISKTVKESLPTLLAYGLLAFPIVYITWPYLWGEPMLRLAITFKVMMRFPWPGKVLYDGNLYDANMLPWHYLPKLYSYQLTEPLLILAFVGFFISIYQVLRKKKTFELFFLASLWFFIPAGAAISSLPYLYDNFRQTFFVLPPLFLFAGAALDFLEKKLTKPVIQGFISVLLILPGLLAGVKLHPYEYIYYNSFIGGAEGASRQYETDYWGTAFREVAIYTNENIEKDAKIIVWGPPTVFWRYGRSDFKVYDFRQENLPKENFYAVISSRVNNDLVIYPDIAPEYILNKNGVILAVVKYIE
ncbi:MAG: hypothetical protein HN390_16375 [Anaerolineae bacterium]|jgi:hypothetical protein|nr:hypothetical protein [Anaerolineae bacterium]MBT7191006.1 hypothetical protein [Anaerolineae bacterium]MBT7989467.1 hypothetical protein [Anaerolineae bacterium]